MAAFKFYEAERDLYPDLASIECSDEAASVAVRKLARHFLGNGARIPVEFSRGTVWSFGGSRGVKLAKGRTWLIVAHEVAHVLDYRKRGRTSHDRRFARVVARVVAYVRKMGWHFDSLGEGDPRRFEAHAGSPSTVEVVVSQPVAVAA